MKSVEFPSLVYFRTWEKALGNLLLLSLPGQDGCPGGSWAPVQPRLFSEPDLAPWSGKSCPYGALKRRSIRISSQSPFIQQPCVSQHSGFGKKIPSVLLPVEEAWVTRCIVQLFSNILLVFCVLWASPVILVSVELFWCAFGYIWCACSM